MVFFAALLELLFFVIVFVALLPALLLVLFGIAVAIAYESWPAARAARALREKDERAECPCFECDASHPMWLKDEPSSPPADDGIVIVEGPPVADEFSGPEVTWFDKSSGRTRS